MNHPLEKIAKRRGRVLAVLDRFFISGVDAAAVTSAVEGLLPILAKRVPYDAVYRSLLPLVGKRPDRELLRMVAWALAADPKGLRSGHPVWPPCLPTKATTVVVQVVASRRLFFRNRAATNSGFPILYRLRVVAGTGAAAEFDVRLSSRFVQYLASRPQGLGFSRPPRGNALPNGRPYQHYETLVGMLLRVDLSIDENGRPKIDNPRCSASYLTYNRALIEMRWRATFVCPFAFMHPCHHCSKGQESCPAATHPRDYIRRFCSACLADSEFDPYWKDQIVCRKCALTGKKHAQNAQ